MKVLILGGASCVWEDVEASEALLGREWWDTAIAANDIGCHWPRKLDHWVTLHPERLGPPEHNWIGKREANGHPMGFVTWARRKHRLVQELIQPWAGGSSGLLAVALAHHLGAERAVLCGVPLDKRPHFAESDVHGREPWSSADSHWRAWQTPRNREKMEGWLKSMSGRTRDHLGAPTLEWLEQREAA